MSMVGTWRSKAHRSRATRALAIAIALGIVGTVAQPQLVLAADQIKCCNQVLAFGQQWSTGTGEILKVQSGDGNVVLYVNGVARWWTSTTGLVNDYLKVQSDGNVVVYTSTNQWRWRTATDLYPGAVFKVQDDGNMVVYSGTTAVWAKSWTQTATGAKAYAQLQFARYAWSTGSQYPCLNSLWTGESNWQWNADNPSSSAYGIPQALPGSKMGSQVQGGATNWLTDGLTQVLWGLQYISGVYSTPCSAYNAWLSRSPHWY